MTVEYPKRDRSFYSIQARKIQKELKFYRVIKRRVHSKEPNETKGLRILKAQAGKSLFHVLRDRVGDKNLTAIARAVEKVKAHSLKKDLERKARIIKRAQDQGIKPQETKRLLLRSWVRQGREVKVYPVKKKGKFKYYEFKEFRHGRLILDKKIPVKDGKRWLYRLKENRRVENIAKTFDLSKTEARDLIKKARREALKTLRKFKRTKKFKKFTKRKQALFTESRYKNMADFELDALTDEEFDYW